jgi:hypothetical protein
MDKPKPTASVRHLLYARAVEHAHRIMLKVEQYDEFARALDNPPPPSEKFKAFMRKKPLWKEGIRRARGRAGCAFLSDRH